jgi:hypothetical protein
MRELDRPAQELAEQGRPRPYPVPQPHSEFEPAHATVSPAHYLLVVWRQKGKNRRVRSHVRAGGVPGVFAADVNL